MKTIEIAHENIYPSNSCRFSLITRCHHRSRQLAHRNHNIGGQEPHLPSVVRLDPFLVGQKLDKRPTLNLLHWSKNRENRLFSLSQLFHLKLLEIRGLLFSGSAVLHGFLWSHSRCIRIISSRYACTRWCQSLQSTSRTNARTSSMVAEGTGTAVTRCRRGERS
jgi:hypothetical protein